MDHTNLFSASTRDMESRTKFNNVNFSSFRGSRGDFNNVYFDGYQSRDSNCNMFNQRNMFEYMNGYNGFTGQAPNSFMASDRDFTYARGRSSVRPIGGSARQVSSGCPSGCSPCYNGVGCCQDGAPETPCASGARKIRGNQVAARQIGNPVDCDGFECGDVAGHRLPVRCPQGCICVNGSCVSAKGRVKSNVAQTNFTGVNRVFPEGRGNYFSGRDMSNGGFRLR